MRFSVRRALRERAFLVESLFILEPDRSRLRALAATDLDWGRLLDVALRHAVAPAVCYSLAREGIAPRLDESTRGRVTDTLESYAASNAVVLEQAATAQAALAAQGIDSLVLKGAALLAAHYPAIEARHVDDVDILVRPENTRDAATALMEHGYRQVETVDHDGQQAENGHHVPPLLGPLGVPVELHWQLPGRRGNLVESAVWKRARRVKWLAHALQVPAPVDLFSAACTHVYSQHDGKWRFLPRHLADLHVLTSTSDLDTQALLGVEGVPESLRLLAAVGRAPRRGWMLPDRLRAASLFTSALPLAQHVAEMAKILSGSPPRLPQRLFPSTRHMAWRYGVRPGSPRLPLLYIRRIYERLAGPLVRGRRER